MHSTIAPICWALISLTIPASLLLSWAAAASDVQSFQQVLYAQLNNVIPGDAVCCTGVAAQSSVVRSAGECALRCGQAMHGCSFFNLNTSAAGVITCELFAAPQTCFEHYPAVPIIR